ncbi:MAG: GNAT family N-acetyltransferase [Candidatus Methanoperedens sp.]|nr:GNAT family N-acetyltransferase [Candidatus Methanoperedens sp.]
MKVAVLYNLPTEQSGLTEIENLAELEVLETVKAVKKALEGPGYEAIPLRCSTDVLSALLKCDAVFNLAEGFGNNLKAEPYVAGLLELTGLPYTGSPPDVLEISRNKYLTKILLEKEGISTPRFQIIKSVDQSLDLDFPVIVKPCLEDASAGITANSVAMNQDEFRKNVLNIIETYHQPVLIEEYIDGREINASILRIGPGTQVLPLSEIVFTLPDDMPKIVTFEAKWKKDSFYYQNTIPKCPAELEPSLIKRIEMLALDACKALGVREYARVDLRIRENEVFVLEVNPNPCINPDGSGFVRSAGAAGLSYSQIVQMILNSAFENAVHPEDQNKNISFNFENLLFRRIKAEDAPLLARWFSDDKATKYMEPSTSSGEEELRIAILTSEDEDFLVYFQNVAIGFASIYHIKKCTGEVSCLIGEIEFRGKGMGNSIFRGLVDYSFTTLGLNSLFASATIENIFAIKSLERAGFRRIGVRRAYQNIGKECLDDLLFDITRDVQKKIKET